MKPSDYEEFQQTLSADQPPNQWQAGLQSLWWDAKGDWQQAHDLVDGSDGKDAARIHAYLHRKEGDKWNAGYWYRRANQPFPEITLDEEFKKLLLAQL